MKKKVFNGGSLAGIASHSVSGGFFSLKGKDAGIFDPSDGSASRPSIDQDIIEAHGQGISVGKMYQAIHRGVTFTNATSKRGLMLTLSRFSPDI